MTEAPIHCVWFKRDLRLLDHRPLVQAMERGEVLPLYIIEPEMITAPDFDAMHWGFIRESLINLEQSIRARGGKLWIEQGEATEVLARIHADYRFQGIYAHEETGNALSFERDKRVASWARNTGISFVEVPQTGVVRALRDRDGWAQVWETRMCEPVVAAPAQIKCPKTVERLYELPTAQQLDLPVEPRQIDCKGGESEGLQVLETFISGRGHRYHREMSSPNTAYDSCSRLSPYLTWGCLSMRTISQSVRFAAGDTMPKIAARAFLSRCHWHCHFMQKLESEPAIEFKAFNRACDELRSGATNTAHLNAWQAGQTGYPFVDACMRSLKAHGWINFRMRAMLVSFASYHLWLDWKCFKDWLACQFIDYEPGIHYSQIQMQSGLTGINTLRIYNPIKQGQDHDSEGTFIRRWVPELAGVPTEMIHEPWKLPEHEQAQANCRVGHDYPLPIVDHKEAVRYARAQFTELRKRDDYWQAAGTILERHGSRKGAQQSRPKRTKRTVDPQLEMDLT